MLYVGILKHSLANPPLTSPLFQVLGIYWFPLTLLSTSILLFGSTFNNLWQSPWVQATLGEPDGDFTLVPFSTWWQKHDDFCPLSTVGTFRAVELMGLWDLGRMSVFLWTANVTVGLHFSFKIAFVTYGLCSFGKLHKVPSLVLQLCVSGGSGYFFFIVFHFKISFDVLVNVSTELSFSNHWVASVQLIMSYTILS